MKTRNLCFDQLKGILIILVIVGHVVVGSIDKSLVRSLIYFFHMPLFLAVTGYFISTTLLALPIKDIIKKYQNRLIAPFLLAYVVYYILLGHHQPLAANIKNMLSLYPYYHLWYVPAVLLFIVYLKFFYYLYQRRLNVIIYFLAVLCLLTTLYFETYVQWHLSNHWLYQALGDKRFYYFFAYFACGFLLSNHKNKLPFYSKYALLGLFVALFVCHYTKVDYVAGAAKVIANFALIVWVLYLCQYQKIPTVPLLVKIGEVSLPIYLWHILLLLLLQKLPVGVGIYYLLSLLVFVLFVVLVIYFEDKNAIINRLFYGKVGTKHAT